MVDGAADLVGASDIGGTDAGDRHSVLLVVVLGLEFVEDLVHGVLVAAVAEIVLGDRSVAEMFLHAVDGERAGVDHAVDSEELRGLETIVHAQDVELGGDVRRVFAAQKI